MPVAYHQRPAHCWCCLAGAAREFLVENCFEIRRLPLSSKSGQSRDGGGRQSRPVAGAASCSSSSSATASQLPARRGRRRREGRSGRGSPRRGGADGDGRGEAAEVVRGGGGERLRRPTPSGASAPGAPSRRFGNGGKTSLPLLSSTLSPSSFVWLLGKVIQERNPPRRDWVDPLPPPNPLPPT